MWWAIRLRVQIYPHEFQGKPTDPHFARRVKKPNGSNSRIRTEHVPCSTIVIAPVRHCNRFFSTGVGAGSGWAGVNGHGGSGWARKSMVHEPHWVAYRAYIPTPEDDHASEK